MHPSKRRIQGDAEVTDGCGSDEEDKLTRPKPKERKRSRRTRVNKYKNPGDEGENDKEKEKRERKVSKYNQKVAEGKGPEKGSLGPKGVVRIRGGQMEFRDVNNPEWSKRDSPHTLVHVVFSCEANILAALAAYHCEFRRQFLDEAAEAGDFGETPFAWHSPILIFLPREKKN